MPYNNIFGICLGILVGVIVGAIVGGYIADRSKRNILESQKKVIDKNWDNYQLLSHWLEIKNEGRSVAEYFEEHGYKHIAIYGMGELANRLCEDLAESDITVDYGIDQDVCNSISRIADVFSPNEELKPVDAVIVTPFYAYDSIKRNLEKKVDCPIISLENVVWSV